MIETILLNYLKSRTITGVEDNIYAETPLKQIEKYILVEKTSSGRNDKLNQATFAIQSISTVSLYEAAELNETVKTTMDKMADEVDEVYAAYLQTDYNFTNPTTKEYRYQAVFDIYY